MCGITAYLGLGAGFALAYQGIKILQNRGYDSCGVCAVSVEGEISVHKYASEPGCPAVEEIGKHAEDACYNEESHCFIFQTRWTTHGDISDKNAHPHQDEKCRIALVHNGIIENCYPLKRFLQKKGYRFRSQTDTEVIAYLIGYYLDQKKTIDEAIHLAIGQLEGTWGLAIMYQETPDHLYLCKKGSPLLVGYGEDFVMASSEASGFSNHVKQYFSLPDGQILTARLEPMETEAETETEESQSYRIMFSNQHVESLNPQQVFSIQKNQTQSLIALTPEPYPHWMLKEIMEQRDSSQRTINYGGRLLNDHQVNLGGLKDHQEDLMQIEDLLILACGTSHHAGLLGSYCLKEIGGFRTVQVIDASEFSLEDLPHHGCNNSTNIPDGCYRTGILLLSQSGETKDVHRAMEKIHTYQQLRPEDPILVFSVVNVVESLIAREALCGVYLNAGREVAVASTKSFTSQAVALYLISLWFAQNRQLAKQTRQIWIQSLRQSQQLIDQTLEGLQSPVINQLIDQLKTAPRIFILGRASGLAIAYEGALKIKEVSYIHAEGYAGGGLKHGPFALIESGTPIILISYQDDFASRMDLAAAETQTRGAYTIALTSRPREDLESKGIYNTIISIPHDPLLSPLLSILPLQYLSYRLALALGHPPDYPRNLAKVVTVDG